MILIHQRHRRTEGQIDGRHAISIPRYALVHRAVKTAAYAYAYEPGLQPLTRAKPFFSAKANFFGQNPAAVNEKNIVFVKRKKGILSSSENTVAESRDFLLITTGCGESGKVILQVSIAVFRALSKNFSGKDGSAP